MAAPKGNEFWKFRTKHGRDKLFSGASVFWEECLKYFKWCLDNPLKEEKVFHNQGEITRTQVAKMRAMTLQGLWFYMKISKDTWYLYKKDKDFYEVIHEAEQVIYDQKFTGAAADLLNPNIIARDLGLVDKKESNVKVGFEDMTEEQLDARREAIETALEKKD